MFKLVMFSLLVSSSSFAQYGSWDYSGALSNERQRADSFNRDRDRNERIDEYSGKTQRCRMETRCDAFSNCRNVTICE